ncbi:MAG TPA: hypothetical protein VLG44_05345 [Chlamydiales bacterium]|nr:hypothetical protein [Chlamydiales bacterium]
MIKRFLFLLPFLFFSCYRVPDTIEPKISSSVEERYIQTLKSPFSSLTNEEKTTDWGKEYAIGLAFAKDLDFYRAISTFKRAEILIPTDDKRKLEIAYYITYCYYLGKKYEEAIYYFERTDLHHVDRSFSAYHDLLLLLYECYLELGEVEKASKIQELIGIAYPETESHISLYAALMEGDLEKERSFAMKEGFQNLNPMLKEFERNKKSVFGAQALNALIPGAGYLYVGLKKSALTAFLLNSLFIFASYEFFKHGYIAAGAITTSFEMGWYFGGIYGAGEQAKYYNERVYENLASPMMNRDKLFPVLMLKYAF